MTRVKHIGIPLLLGLAFGCFCPDAGAGRNITVQAGRTVTVHYTLTVDHKVVDSSRGRAPLRYVQGMNQVIPGLEEQMLNLKQGDKKHFTVPPEKAYGAVNQEAFQNVPKSAFPNPKELKVGGIVTGQFKNDKNPVRATILGMDKKNVVLDLNHPLAGKTLEFDVEVARVE